MPPRIQPSGANEVFAPPSGADVEIRGKVLRRMIPQNGIGAEIGVHKGHFIRTILDVTQPARLHLIDPWYLVGAEWPWAQGNRSTIDALVGILHSLEKELTSGLVALHIGYDADILPTFPDQYFDWVYLDTTHFYEETRVELQLLKAKVKPAGVIVGDDWHADPGNKDHGVFRAVHEFIKNEPYELIYADDRDKQWALKRLAPHESPRE